MDILTAPAKDVYYREPIPENVDPEAKIPIRIDFQLGDLVPEKGYTLTPTDELFRKTVDRVEIPIHRIRLELPRSGGFPLFESRPLEFLAERGNQGHFVESDRLRPFIIYERHLFRGSTTCDSLDTGETTLDDILKYVKERPIGETLTLGFDGVKMTLHTGYDHGESLR